MVSPILVEGDGQGASTQPLPGVKQPGRARKTNKAEAVPKNKGVPKRRPGRPRKIVSPPQPTDSAPDIPATTKAGRVVKMSEKSSMEAISQAEKLDADQLATAKKELKTTRAEFQL